MQPPLFCDNCGAANRSQAAYCRSCGYSLQMVQPGIYNSATGCLLADVLLKQRYRIIAPIGQGGMGAVYRAEDMQLGNRQVALKEMSQSGLNPQEQQQAADAFKQEAIMLARLQHPNLPSIFDHFEENKRWYLVMSFIEGETLKDYLGHTQSGKLPLAEAIQIGIQLCTVLSYLHNQQPPIIFRDLKPDNIMLTPTADGHIYLIDFGIARHFKPQQAKDTAYIGSPGYAPAEQYGKAQTTPRSDIYSLGATLHQLISGHDPASSPFRFPPLQSLVPTIPTKLALFITQMLEIDEDKRPANTLLVKQELQLLVVPTLPNPANPPSTPVLPPTQPVRQNPTPLVPVIQPTSLSTPQPQGSGKPAVQSLTPGALLFRYTGHANDVWSAAWSPDGKRIASGSTDKTVQVWNADGSEQPFICEVHSDVLGPGALSPDGKRIAAFSDDKKTIKVWNADGSGQPFTYSGHIPNVPQVAVGLGEAPVASPSVYFVVWSPDSSRIASCSGDNIVQVWNVDGSGQSFTYNKFLPSPLSLSSTSVRPYYSRAQRARFYILSATWSPDGTQIASGFTDGTVQLWNVDGSGRTFTYSGHLSAERSSLSLSVRIVLSVAWSPDSKRIASSSTDNTVQIWNADGSGQPFTYNRHSAKVLSVAWSPDGKRIASGSADKTVQVWNVDGSRKPYTYIGHDNEVLSVAWSSDNKRIASGSADNTVQIWNADGSGQRFTYRRHFNMVLSVAWLPDGKRIASVAADKTVQIWNADGSRQPLISYPSFYARSVVWSPDGARIAAFSNARDVRVWNVDGSGQPFSYKGHTSIVEWLAWSPDGTRIASASRDKTVQVWNADGSGQPFLYGGHTDAVLSVVWSPDGMRIASASCDKTVHVWNVDGSGQPFIYKGHSSAINAIAWSPDGTRIVSASADKEDAVHIWNVDGSGQPFIYEGHNYFAWEVIVTSVAWSPDGMRIASGTSGSGALNSSDKTVHIWNADGSGQPFIYEGHTGGVLSVAWSPDGTLIASTSKDHTVQVWSVG